MAESSLIRKLKKSFPYFLTAAWKHLNLPVPTKRQLEMAEYLQNGPQDLIIMAFRGIGKSWITSAFVCWLLFKNPHLKIMVVSASQPRADKFTTFTLRLIKEWSILKHLSPKTDQRESMACFDVAGANNAHAPSMLSIGISGQMTGNRADIIIADDVEVPKNSATDDLREKLMGLVGEFHDIIVPEGSPRVIFLGTPQTEESIYNKLRDRGYECRIWPARFPNSKQILGYKGALAPTMMAELAKDGSLTGNATDPGRFNNLDLADREARKGRSSFLLQFMLDTTLSDAEKYPLKTSDMIVIDCTTGLAPSNIQYSSKPDSVIKELRQIGFSGDRFYRPMWMDEKWLPFEVVYMAIDPAGRGKDETGYAVLGHLHGNLYLLAIGGLKGGYTDTNLIHLATIAKKHKVNEIVVEANFGDGMWTKLFNPHLQKIWPCTVEEVKATANKEGRIIDTLEPILNQHRLIVDQGALQEDIDALLENPERNQRYSFLYQMTRLTRERGALKHDDRIDALALAASWHLEGMARDTQKADEAAKARAVQEELNKIYDHFYPHGEHRADGAFSSRFNR